MTQEQHKPPPRRITVNLAAESDRALARAMEIGGDGLTGVVNRALRVYAYMLEVQAKGGDLIVRDAPEGMPERLVIMLRRGGLPERPKGPDCKSGAMLRRFEPSARHDAAGHGAQRAAGMTVQFRPCAPPGRMM